MSPNDEDRQQWVRVLNLLIDMGKYEISTSQINPFMFEKYQKRQAFVSDRCNRHIRNVENLHDTGRGSPDLGRTGMD